MCLILFGYRTEPDLPLVVAANRDEFHARRTAVADFWSDHPQVLAGRDLVAGGTWLGCTRGGRFAALTNFSDPDAAPAARSRGLLVQDFLTGVGSAQAYAEQIATAEYAGFNLLLFDGQDMVYTSNRVTTRVLQPGFYGLTNAALDARWPKAVQGAARLRQTVAQAFCTQDLLEVLCDTTVPDDDDLPCRGRPLDLERQVSPCFITGQEYGTRASTGVIFGHTELRFSEQSYAASGVATARVDHRFEIARP